MNALIRASLIASSFAAGYLIGSFAALAVLA